MAEIGTHAFVGTERFEILHPLGEGGMGVVYAARDRVAQQTVALKTLSRVDALNLARFKNEFRALADLVHPNLVRLGELFSEGERLFFTMELVTGVSFLDYVRLPPDESMVSPTEPTVELTSRIPFDETHLRAALRQLARGVAAIHAAGKVHRDIKPSNILVTSEGRVVVLDFGLIANADREGLSETGLVGTPRYMAPEQAAEIAVGPAADWYAMGTVLYEPLCGHAPFGGTRLEVLMNKNKFEPPSPRVLCKDVPEDLSDLCAQLLRMDPKARPRDREVLARLGVVDDGDRPSVSTASSLTGHAPFVGRLPELALLERAFQDRQDGAVTVLLHGESGIGKSALVRHFCDTLAARDASTWILHSRCYEREFMAYKAFDGIMDALARRLEKLPPVDAALLLTSEAGPLVRLFPVLRRCEVARRLPAVDVPDPQELRRRAFAQLRALLFKLATRFPLVLCIDDLQWADADSWVLARDVLHAPFAPPLLLLGTVQTGVSYPAQDLGPVRELSLEALAEADGLALVTELMGKSVGDADAFALAKEGAGHPLFLGELAHEARRSGWQKKTLLLEELISLRVQALSEDARRLVELLAVAAAPLSSKAAGLAADVEGPALDKILSLLRAGHLCRATGEGDAKALDLYHNRIRAAVLSRLPASRVTEHHAGLARALELTGEDPAGLIRHLEAVGDTQRAAAHAEAMADLARNGLAFARAATFYQKALELGEPAKARGLRVKLGDALAKAGRGAEAAAEFLRAVPGAPSAQALDLRRQATDQYMRSGHVDQGLESARAVLAEVGLTLPATPRRALLSLLFLRARLRLRGLGFRVRDATQVSSTELARIDVCSALGVCLGWADTILGASFQARALLYALHAGEPTRLFDPLVWEAGFAASQGGPARGRTERILAVAERLHAGMDEPELGAWLQGVRGYAAYMRGQWRVAQAQAENAEQIFRGGCIGVAWELDSVQLLGAWSLYYQGRLAELSRRVAMLFAEAEARGDLHLATNVRLSTLTAAWLVSDDVERAREQARQAMARGSQGGYHMQHWCYLLAEVNCALYLGEGAEAWQRVVADGPRLRRSLLLRMQLLRIEFTDLRARAALAAAREAHADRELLLRSAARDAHRLRREKTPYSTALATLLDAGVAAARGHSEEATDLYAASATQFDAADMALHAAVARLRQGELIGGDSGQALVTSAQAWFAHQTVKNPARWAQMIAPAGASAPVLST